MSVKSDPPEGATRRLLPDTVAARIQAKILDGTFRPGDRLPPERELADQLKVNRSSLREALKKLEQLRLISIQQGSGIRVRSPDEASFDLVWSMLFIDGHPNLPRIRDLLELRETLLPSILRLAIERGSAAEIEEGVCLTEEAADPTLEESAFSTALQRLQDHFARVADNQIVIMLSNSLQHFLAQRGFQLALLLAARNRTPVLSFLRRLAVALRARDAESAVKAHTEFIRNSSRALLDALERAGTRSA